MDTVAALLKGELARLGWVQADLARVLGWQVQTLSELMQDKRRLDAGMALGRRLIDRTHRLGSGLQLKQLRTSRKSRTDLRRLIV